MHAHSKVPFILQIANAEFGTEVVLPPNESHLPILLYFLFILKNLNFTKTGPNNSK